MPCEPVRRRLGTFLLSTKKSETESSTQELVQYPLSSLGDTSPQKIFSHKSHNINFNFLIIT